MALTDKSSRDRSGDFLLSFVNYFFPFLLCFYRHYAFILEIFVWENVFGTYMISNIRPVQQDLANNRPRAQTCVPVFTSYVLSGFWKHNEEQVKREKERCSGSYCQAVGFPSKM